MIWTEIWDSGRMGQSRNGTKEASSKGRAMKERWDKRRMGPKEGRANEG